MYNEGYSDKVDRKITRHLKEVGCEPISSSLKKNHKLLKAQTLKNVDIIANVFQEMQTPGSVFYSKL